MLSSEQDLVHRLQAIIDTAIDGIITIDSKGIIETINPAGAFMFGYNPVEVIGKNVSILMPNPHRSNHDQYINSYLTTHIPKIIGIGREVMALRKDGSQFPFRLAVNEVILNDRIIFTGIVHDLSEVKQAETELLRMNEELEDIVEKRTNELEEVVNRLLSTNSQLEENETKLTKALAKEKELNELKSRFVSMASHEFRTPLSTILSSATLISRYKLEDQDANRQKHIDRIKSAVSNLTGILNDFLSLSKLEEGKVEIILTRFNVSDLCQTVYDEVQGLMKEGQSIIHKHKGAPDIYSDDRILKNVFFNLVTNAIKYSGPNDSIACHTEVNSDGIYISVKDNGIGIPIGEQKHLFNRFFRASNVETIQGTGLGLNIVKEYIELLRGSITFESHENEGTTFFINIPLEKNFDS
jgi:two-component system, LuxR family, sensor kinase FixL